MISTLWKLTTTKEKVIVLIMCLLLICSFVGVIKYQHSKIEQLTYKLTVSEVNRQNDKMLYNVELEKAQKTISEQNIQIEEFRLDNTSYEMNLHEHEKELISKKVKAQEDIKRELEKDDSLENQMRLMAVTLQEFSDEK